MYFAATNSILMGLRCYTDSWVYCTNNLPLTYLWLYLRQGKLHKERVPIALSSQHSIFFPVLGQTVAPTATRADEGPCGFLYFTFCKKQTPTWNLKSFFWSLLRIVEYAFSSVEESSCISSEAFSCWNGLPIVYLLQSHLLFGPNTQGKQYQQLNV